MDRRYQVFVSSTYLDLVDERREIIQALLEIECLPAGMEMFPAASESQWSLIKKVIDQSDFYVVVIGGRYGSTTPEGLSYTEMEYDYAVETGKPTLGFVHEQPGRIPADKSELEPEARARLEAFRNKVQSNHVKFYGSPEDLGGKVSRAMNLATRNTDAEGWVRGRFAMTEEIRTEMAELRVRASELALAATAKTAVVIPADLSSGDEFYVMKLTFQYQTRSELAAEENSFIPAPIRTRESELSVTWNDLIRELGPRMFDEVSEPMLASAVRNFAQRRLLNDRQDLLPNGFGQMLDLDVAQETFDDITLQMFALNVTEHGTKNHRDTHKYWKLSELGNDTLMRLRAIRKQRDTAPNEN